MQKAISLYSIVPVRAEAREGAEQNTQMLFGETCEIVPQKTAEEKPGWVYVRLDSDGQEGWADAKMICPMKSKEFASYRATLKGAAMVAFPMAYAMSENNGQTIPLTAGTKLSNYQIQMTNGTPTARFEVLGVGFRIDPGMVITEAVALDEPNLLRTVRFFLNTPYLWGGKNALGMDCSGFAQVVMSLFGRKLLRNASQQVTQGRAVASLKKAKTGDLAFFDHEDGKISHVGILIDADRIVHCSGRVKVEGIDQIGIFNAETGKHSHHLVCIRRV